VDKPDRRAAGVPDRRAKGGPEPVPWEAGWFEGAPVGFLVVRPDGTVQKANPRLLAWAGLAWEELAGTSWFDTLLTPAGRVLVQTHLVPLLAAQGWVRDIALDLRTATGERLHVLVSAELCAGPGGVGAHQRLTFLEAKDPEAWQQDLLEARRRAEDTAEALRELNLDLEAMVAARTEDLAQANQDLRAYVRTVTHHLRNPLQAILSLAEILELSAGSILAPDQRLLLRQITQAGTAMRTLVSSLLQMAYASDKPLDRTTVDLSGMARRLAAELQAAAPRRQLEWDIQPGLEAYGDQGLLEVALRNLLGNAWKYSEGSEAARIGFEMDHGCERPAFCVRDNGRGFDAARAEALFQPFQRFHTSKEFPGLGIGLATVKRILDRHGGRLWAESSVGQGAAFFFTLPPDLPAV
jgi:signal transduction histidine kinase